MSHHQGADYTPQRYPVKLFRFADSLGAQTVRRLPAMQETQVRSPGQEDLLEKKMATHSSTLA